LWKVVFRPEVSDARDLRRYVFSVTLFAWTVAFAVDLVNQLAFFSNWGDCLREWSVTTAVVVVIALPIARTIGRAHLRLHLARVEAERLSRIDPLTGLANRRAFYEAASQLGNGVLALVIADIDRFKRINDRYGHAVGDEIIKSVGRRMQAELGDLGTVARLGGEEFALVTAGRPSAEIRARLEQLRGRLADEPAMVAGQRVQATVSIGLAARREHDFEALYAAADKALYVAKTAGRDRVVDFDEIGEAGPAAMLRAG
jgi:diguanylate cyclase (GGDEF)-like protein